jgi:hypothetical protein
MGGPKLPAAILNIAFNDCNESSLLIYRLIIAITMNIDVNNLDSSLCHGPITTASAPYPGSIGRLLLSKRPKRLLGCWP